MKTIRYGRSPITDGAEMKKKKSTTHALEQADEQETFSFCRCCGGIIFINRLGDPPHIVFLPSVHLGKFHCYYPSVTTKLPVSWICKENEKKKKELETVCLSEPIKNFVSLTFLPHCVLFLDVLSQQDPFSVSGDVRVQWRICCSHLRRKSYWCPNQLVFTDFDDVIVQDNSFQYQCFWGTMLLSGWRVCWILTLSPGVVHVMFLDIQFIVRLARLGKSINGCIVVLKCSYFDNVTG